MITFLCGAVYGWSFLCMIVAVAIYKPGQKDENTTFQVVMSAALICLSVILASFT